MLHIPVGYSIVLSNKNLLECHHLFCGYKNKTVLENLNFQVAKGEIVALLGTNGSGKSTLLRTLSKTLPPIKGQVLLEGKSQNSLSFKQLSQCLAYVPQEAHCAFGFTALQSVLMARVACHNALFETEEDYRMVNWAMDKAGCSSLATRPITQLSGGERQRVLIARALAQEAPLLLLDEPTSHLDVRYQLEIAHLLRQLVMNGYGILVTLHDLNWASVIADRIIILKDGKIALEGSTEEVLKSSSLASCYGVEFYQFYDPMGHWRSFPKLSDKSNTSPIPNNELACSMK